MSAVPCAACGAVAATRFKKRQHNGTFSQLGTFALPSCTQPPKSSTADRWQRYCKPRIATHARKHGDEAEDVKAAGEWAALAYTDKDDEELAADLQQKLNKICNEGLKLMLKDSSTRELEEYKDKVSAVGAAFSKDNDMQGATFAYVLYKMAEHVQVEQIHNLQGVYKAACLKMFGLLEDSGWALNKEGEEGTDRPQDENPLPDVPTLGSYSGIV
ncbi:TPA: hypothetical protein ACH3X3_000729 [Trebouxia sp. C0006]